MSQKSMSSLFVLLALLACRSDALCPVGTTKSGDVCVAQEPAATADAAAELDAAAPDLSPDAAMPLAEPPDAGASDADSPRAEDAGPDCDAGSDAEVCRPVCDPRPELCNGEDEDCDGVVDNGVTVRVYVDADGDGHGDLTDEGEVICVGSPTDKVTSNDDCNDACATCTPGNVRELTCDGKDDDCNGDIDDGVLTAYALDCDGDRHAAPDASLMRIEACAPPVPPAACPNGLWRDGGFASGDDCNDSNASVFAGNTEQCDSIDNDCDRQVDEGLLRTYKLDCDGDRYLESDPTAVTQCPARPRPAPTGCAAAGGGADYAPQWLEGQQALQGIDCADSDAEAFPGSTTSSSSAVGGRPGFYDFNCDGNQEIRTRPRMCTTADRNACRPGGAGHNACFGGAASDVRCGATLTMDVCICEAEIGCRNATTSFRVSCR